MTNDIFGRKECTSSFQDLGLVDILPVAEATGYIPLPLRGNEQLSIIWPLQERAYPITGADPKSRAAQFHRYGKINHINSHIFILTRYLSEYIINL